MAGDEEGNSVAPNVEHSLHGPVVLLHIGDPAYRTYVDSTTMGFFHAWIPPLGGDLIIELEPRPGTKPRVIVRRDTRVVVADLWGTPARHRLDPSFSGRLDFTVTPAGTGVRLKMKFEGWAEDDGKPLIPWNFWYFPYRPADPPNSKFKSRTVQVEALELYDAFTGNTNAAAWEKRHHCKDEPSVQGWEGHCLPAAYASVMFHQPLPTRTVKGIKFDRAHLELIATEWTGGHLETEGGWHHDPVGRLGIKITRKPNERGQKRKPEAPVGLVTLLLRPEELDDSTESLATKLEERYLYMISRFPEAQEYTEEVRKQARVLSGMRSEFRDAFGRIGLEMWTSLVGELSGPCRPIVGDFGPPSGDDCGEVWNQAVVMIKTSVVEESFEPGSTVSSDPRVFIATVEVFMNLDLRPDPNLQPAVDPWHQLPARDVGGKLVVNGAASDVAKYRFRFSFKGPAETGGQSLKWLSGRFHGGASFTPRTFGSPMKPGRARINLGDGNPDVELGVLSLVELRSRFA